MVLCSLYVNSEQHTRVCTAEGKIRRSHLLDIFYAAADFLFIF